MKFLCVACDEPMKLHEAGPPDRGSLAVVYGCPKCGHRIAMLTNPMETEMVRSLGVRIGPAAAHYAAAGGGDQPRTGEAAAAQPPAGDLGAAAPPAASAAPGASTGPPAGTPAAAGTSAERAAAGGCPFSGMVAEMEAARDGVTWTREALSRLENIPDFVRPMARQGIEHYAKSQGHAVVDERILDEARAQFGM